MPQWSTFIILWHLRGQENGRFLTKQAIKRTQLLEFFVIALFNTVYPGQLYGDQIDVRIRSFNNLNKKELYLINVFIYYLAPSKSIVVWIEFLFDSEEIKKEGKKSEKIDNDVWSLCSLFLLCFTKKDNFINNKAANWQCSHFKILYQRRLIGWLLWISWSNHACETLKYWTDATD